MLEVGDEVLLGAEPCKQLLGHDTAFLGAHERSAGRSDSSDLSAPEYLRLHLRCDLRCDLRLDLLLLSRQVLLLVLILH